ADVVQLNIRGPTAGEKLWILRVVTLPWEHSRDALAPHFLDRIEDAQFVIDHHIPLSGIKALHIGKFLLLMDIDEDAAVESCPNPGPIDFPRLEPRVAIRQDDCRTPLLDMFDRIKRARVKAIAEGIVASSTSAVSLDRASFRAEIVPMRRGSRHSRVPAALPQKYPSNDYRRPPRRTRSNGQPNRPGHDHYQEACYQHQKEKRRRASGQSSQALFRWLLLDPVGAL